VGVAMGGGAMLLVGVAVGTGDPGAGVPGVPTGGASPPGVPPSATVVVGVGGRAVRNRAFMLKYPAARLEHRKIASKTPPISITRDQSLPRGWAGMMG